MPKIKLKKLATNYQLLATSSWLRYVILLISLTIIGFGILYLFRTQEASAWYHDNWAHRKILTIDADQVSGSSNLENFPVLVSLTSDSNLNDNAQADGDDILFTDKQGNKLDHEIESYSSGTLVAWIRIPSLSPTNDTELHMYYGNPQTTDQSNVIGVWDSSYKGVWHMVEDPSISTDGDCGGGTKELCDSTSNNHDVDSFGSMTTEDKITGKIGNALDFDGSDDYMRGTLSIDDTQYFGATLSVWIYAPTDTDGLEKPFYNNAIETIWRSGENRLYAVARTNDGSTSIRTPAGGMPSINEWHHIVVVYDGSDVKQYADGQLLSTDLASSLTGYLNSWATGSVWQRDFYFSRENNDRYYFTGYIDESRLATTARSADWIATEYANQNSPSTFYSTGHQETRTRGPVLHLKLDEGHGTTTKDSSPNNNDGTITNATWATSESCVSEKCLQFDGFGDYLTVSDDNTIDLTNELTIETWLRPNDTSIGTLGTISSWTSLTAPDGADNQDASEIDTVIIAEKIYYVAFLHTLETEYFYTAYSDLDGSNFSGWTSQTAPDGTSAVSNTDASSVAINSDGTKLYYAALVNDGTIEKFYTAYSDLDGSNFSSWTDQADPDGCGNTQACTVDMTIVGDTMYYAAVTHTSSPNTSSFYTAYSDLEGLNFSGWTSQTPPFSSGFSNMNRSIALDSDGEQLYYAALSASTSAESYAITRSNLDGGNLEDWTSITAPDGANGVNYHTTDLAIIGNKIYYVAFLSNDSTKSYHTATSNLDGTDFTSWSGHTAPTGTTSSQASNTTALATDGKKLFFSAFHNDDVTEYFNVTSLDLPNYQPLISKSGAYELIQNGGGFTLDWAGVPHSFGSITDNQWNHVALSFDGSNMNYYVNGDLKRTQTTTSATFTSNANDLRLAFDGTNYYQGYMDDIQIYNYARSAGEIKQNYLGGSTVFGSSPPDKGGAGGLSQGLVGYWTMEDNVSGDAQTITDHSGNGNHGTTSDTNATGMDCTTAGKYGGGCDFDGSDDYVNFSPVIDVSSSPNGFTYAAWVYWEGNGTTNAFQTILGDNQPNNNFHNIFFIHDGDNSLYYSAYNHTFGQGSGIMNSGLQITPNTWTFVALVFEETSLYRGKYHFYKNNSRYSTSDGVVEDDADFIKSIGAARNNTNLFNGIIDEVRIYNRPLNQSEMDSLYRYAPGPVAFYNFDEGSGTSLNDISGNGNTATLGGDGAGSDLPIWSSGKYGNALEFDGNDDYINTGSQFNFSQNQSFTVQAWMKTSNTTSGVTQLVDKGFGFQNTYSLYYDESNSGASFSLHDTSRIDVKSSNNSTYSDNEWHLFTGVRDTVADELYIYVDGILKGTTTDTTTGNFNRSSDIIIGARGNSTTQEYFDGAIDEVRIYNYARTQEQILEDMNAGHPAIGTPVGSTILHLSFDEGYGDTANDKSPLGNHADLAGTSYTCPQTGDTSCPTWDNNGKIGKALNFSTTGTQDDSIEVPNESDYDITNSFTISTWFKRNATGAVNQGILAKNGNYSNANGNFAMFLDSTRDGNLYCHFWVSSFTWIGMNTSDTYDIDDTNWHHITCTFDFATKTGTLYVDNQVAGTTTWTTEVPATNNNPLIIGYYSNYYLNFNGVLDELKIYPFALSADQVATEYNQGKQTVLGSTGTDSSGNPDNSANRQYCIPGDTTTCSPPVLELNMEENTGTTAYDTSSNGNTGTLTGNPTWRSPADCKEGNCIEFDGNGDYLNIADNSILEPTNLTISAWVKSNITDYTSAGGIITKRHTESSAPFNSYVLEIFNSNDNPRFCISIASQTCVTATDPITTEWTHITGRYDGSAIKIYINGVEDNSTNLSGSISYTNLSLRIAAARTDITTEKFNGLIDQVRIYDYARTPAQIAWDYNQGAPVAHYKFDECSGSTAYDASGNTNHGTITPGGLPNSSVGTCSSGISTEMWNNGTTGKWGSSLDFDGSDDYINIPDSNTLNFLNSSASVSTWVYWNGSSNYERIISKANTFSPYRGDFYLQINGAENPQKLIGRFKTGSGITENPIIEWNTNFPTNTWTHVIITFDTNTNTSRLYINGKLIDEDTNSTEELVDTTNFLCIGCNSSFTSSFFNGQLDDVRIYNYALTAEQVKMVHNNGAINFQ